MTPVDSDRREGWLAAQSVLRSPHSAVVLAGSLWVGASLALAFTTFWWQATQGGGLAAMALPLLVPALGFAGISFGLRALRWHFFLAAAGAQPPFWTSLKTQLIGFSLTMTPGKIGEIYKCYLVEQRTGVPTARTAPIILFEKLMDAVAFAALALAAAAVLPDGAESVSTAARMLIIIFVLAVALAAALHRLRPDEVARFLLRTIGRSPLGRRFASLVGLALIGSVDVLKGPLLARNALLSIAARACDGLSLAWAAWALGVHLPPVAAIFVFNSSGMLGGLSMLPGGVGVVEGGMSVLLATLGASPGEAVAATLLVRLMTFWLWVSIGLCLLVRSGMQNHE